MSLDLQKTDRGFKEVEQKINWNTKLWGKCSYFQQKNSPLKDATKASTKILQKMAKHQAGFETNMNNILGPNSALLNLINNSFHNMEVRIIHYSLID